MNATSENPILSWQEEETNWQVGAKKSGRTTAVTQDKEKREREREREARPIVFFTVPFWLTAVVLY